MKFRTHFDIRDWGVGIRISRYHPSNWGLELYLGPVLFDVTVTR
jgi:hypothetical protein